MTEKCVLVLEVWASKKDDRLLTWSCINYGSGLRETDSLQSGITQALTEALTMLAREINEKMDVLEVKVLVDAKTQQ